MLKIIKSERGKGSKLSFLEVEERSPEQSFLLLRLQETELKQPPSLPSAVPGVKRRDFIWEGVSASFNTFLRNRQKQA